MKQASLILYHYKIDDNNFPSRYAYPSWSFMDLTVTFIYV